MDDGAAVDGRGHFEQRDLTGRRIDLDLRRLRREVVRARSVAVTAVVGKFRRVVKGAHPDDRLATRLIDMRAHDRRYRLNWCSERGAARSDLR